MEGVFRTKEQGESKQGHLFRTYVAVHTGNRVLRIFKVNIPSLVQVLLLYVFQCCAKHMARLDFITGKTWEKRAMNIVSPKHLDVQFTLHNAFITVFVGPSHHGMARPQVADGGTTSKMQRSCE